MTQEEIEICLDNINNSLINSGFDYEKKVSAAIKNCPSNLDAGDYAFCVIIGILSCVLNTNDKIEDFFDKVHTAGNGRNAKWDNKIEEKIGSILGKILHHSGDNIDMYEGSWKARNSNIPGAGPHRVMWGHDILSISEDNPYYLLIKQYGFAKGIFQATRHLIADTCSKQGLPLPGSSWFDYKVVEKSGEERIHNYLVEFANRYCKEVLGHGERGINNTVFNSFFSIHATDAISNGLITTGLSVYCKVRGVIDKVRIQQMRVISYAFNFFGTTIIETAKSGGIPKINWISFFALSSNLLKLIKTSNKETNEFDFFIMQLEAKSNELQRREEKLHIDILYDLRNTLTDEAVDKRNELIDFFGGE